MNILDLSYIAFLTFASLVFIRNAKTKHAAPSRFKNVFWALTAFVIMKLITSVITQGQSIIDTTSYISILLESFRGMASVVSNVFLFHFGISILTYKINTRIDYKIFPVLLLLGIIMFYLTGIFQPSEFEKISRFSFGYNGAILGFVGCINLYLDKRETLRNDISLYGLILLGVFLLMYAVTDGVLAPHALSNKMIKTISAGVVAAASLMLNNFIKKEGTKKVGFV
ncbi:MAG: hypothetical protein HY752_06855 [Nitrospirae bacterium]|nr:hypothetical protein [Nitrospirota bacterium]